MIGLLCVATLATACGEDRPYFASVVPPEDTSDTVGPYRAEAWVVATKGVRTVVIRFLSDDGTEVSASDFPLVESTGSLAADDAAELWTADLPGRPLGTTLRYFFVLLDTIGQKVTFPATAPDETVSLSIE